MPKFPTPDGRADLESTTEHLVDYLLANAVGISNIIGAHEVAEMYDIKVWQAHTCLFQARVQLRHVDSVLCGKRGVGGGFFVAETEEEARAYGLGRSEFTLTEIDNIVKDVEVALRGIVRSAPSTELYWKRTRSRLKFVAGELEKVRADLALGASGHGGELPPGPLS